MQHGVFPRGRSLTRVLDPARHCSRRAKIRQFDILIGIELGAVFDCIHQKLPQRPSYRVSFPVRQVDHLANELDEPISRFHIAPRGQTDPVWGTRQNFDAIIPTWLFHSVPHNVCQRCEREWRREITKSALTNRLKYVARRTVIRQDEYGRDYCPWKIKYSGCSMRMSCRSYHWWCRPESKCQSFRSPL